MSHVWSSDALSRCRQREAGDTVTTGQIWARSRAGIEACDIWIFHRYAQSDEWKVDAQMGIRQSMRESIMIESP